MSGFRPGSVRTVITQLHALSQWALLVPLLGLTPGWLQADSSKVATGQTCISGWFPVNHYTRSPYLKISTCPAGHKKDFLAVVLQDHPPGISLEELPYWLPDISQKQDKLQAVIQSHSPSHNQTLLININSDNYTSSTAYYGWAAVDTGLFFLHIYKAVAKAVLLVEGQTSNRNQLFFISYMAGALHHLIANPALPFQQQVSAWRHYLMHFAMLPVSILERVFDCSCCSQFKNGHNTMILYHAIALFYLSF